MSAGLTLEGVRVRYGSTPVLDRVDIPSLGLGGVVGLLGRNAAGKSSLLKAIAGQASCDGRIAFGGVDLTRASGEARLGLVGYLPQTPPQSSRLLAWELGLGALRATVPGLARAEAEERISGAFDRFDLQRFALRPVSELSGGKRQLLALAIALARQVPLLLLDEPTSALDLRWQVESFRAVRDAARRGALALVALHDINLALGACDAVVVLGEGQVLAAGPPGEMMTADLLRRAYGVDAHVERLSDGRLVVVVDRAGREPSQQGRD